ncbi:hypothetical protein OIO90_002076 [Microbotryomycetes sp. JL221]|nr:hypothetical protein OIO90_002076 [Microbotryomycetes sp. JL221]
MQHLAVARAEFAYAAATQDELTVEEDQLVWIIENDDADWHKVKIKSADPAVPGEAGLVPASYLTPVTPLRHVTALYDYVPTVTATGELENDEELAINEGEQLELIEEETDWCLVQRPGGQGAGFVPTTYVESADGQETQDTPADYEDQQAEEPATTDYVEPAAVVSRAPAASAGNVKTWAVTEIDKKKKKKKGTLGVGNGAVFFASESDKTPVQQYPLAELTDITHEKSKHLHLTFPSAGELHFVIGSKDAFDEILEKIESDRAGSAPSPVAPAAVTSSSIPTAPPAPPVAPATSYIPPPPPIRTASSNVIPPPPIRTASTNGTSSATAPTSTSQQTNAVALYDFESQGDDELSLLEGQRLWYLDGASDDPEWAKVRKVETGEEGVVPMSYIEIDDAEGGATAAVDNSNAAEEDRRRQEQEEEEEAERQRVAADEAALAAQLKADARAARDKEREKETRRKEAKAEQARQNRLSQAPRAAPIPVPQSHDVDDDEPPQLAPRPKEREREKKSVRKPDARKIRTWKDRTGQFKVEAEFLGFKDNKIRLHKLNGVIIEVPIEKMSAEDTAYLKKAMGGSGSSRDESGRTERERERRHKSSRTPSEDPTSRQPSSSKPTQSSATASAPRKSTYDWFDFFLAAGCDPHHIDRYARNAGNEGLDESSIPDLEESNLRSLGLKEGDVIRTKKYIREKFGNPPPPTPEKSERDAQIAADALLAKALQNGTPVPPAPNLFSSGPDGALKPRRGRRNTAASGQSSVVDSNAIASAGEQLSKTQISGPPRVASPVTSSSATSEANRSRANTQTSGFDDDAWEVKPSPTSTKLSEVSAPAKAASPPPAPPAPAPATSAPAPQSPTRAGSAGPPSSSGSTLTYNDGLLAQLGISDRPPSAPASSNAGSLQSAMATGGSFSQPPNGPRAPLLPVPGNQGLLAPMIPTPTGFNAARMNPMMPMATGFGAMGMQPAFTGMPMMSQPTGFGGMSAPMSMQPTGAPSFIQAQPTGFSHAPSMLQPQATGMMAAPSPQSSVFGSQASGFNPAPARFSPAPPAPMQQPQQTGHIQFNPMPPTPQSQQQQSTGSTNSSTSDFAPSNIFSSMKSGTFATGGRQLGPQDASKYDALRPQATGLPSFGGPIQPQPTGFGGMQPQMTGFGNVQPQQPQFTGMPQFGQPQNGFRQASLPASC